jgi:hypothetical protein
LTDYTNSALGFGLTNAWWSDLPHTPGPLPHARINAFPTDPEIVSAATRTGHRR